MGELVRDLLHVSDLEDLRRVLQAPNNLDWLVTLICWYIRDHLFLAFPFTESNSGLKKTLQRLGTTICSAILVKLRRHYPSDVQKGDSILLRYRYKRAVVMLNQALAHTIDVWTNDFQQHPRATLSGRCKRLLPKLRELPGRGSSALGSTHLLLYLVFYEEALRTLAGVPDLTKPFAEADRERREQAISESFDVLPDVLGRASTRFRHPQTGQLFFEGGQNEIRQWSSWPKSRIAEDIAVRIVKGRRKLSPKYLHLILPKLRNIARSLDGALKMK